jgi:TniQ
VDKQAGSSIRPLARSLDPFEGESLGGYLLRLSCRLRLSPIRLARQIMSSKTRLSRSLLLDLDVAAFAHATRLTASEAAALTLIPWASRYPPIAGSPDIRTRRQRGRIDNWLFNDIPRASPATAARFSSSTAAPGNWPGTCRSVSPAPTTAYFSGKTVPVARIHSGSRGS